MVTEARGDVALEPNHDVQNYHGGQRTLSQEHLSMDASGNVDAHLEVKNLHATRVNGSANDQKWGTLAMEGK